MLVLYIYIYMYACVYVHACVHAWVCHVIITWLQILLVFLDFAHNLSSAVCCIENFYTGFLFRSAFFLDRSCDEPHFGCFLDFSNCIVVDHESHPQQCRPCVARQAFSLIRE